jgi:hypothetical protein
LRPAHAYLLYRNVQFVIGRTDILRRANDGVIPGALFGGFYDLAATDAARANAIYRRTTRPAGEFATDPSSFTENVAHVSYLERASLDGAAIRPSDFATRLPFLHDEAGSVEGAAPLVMDLVFAAQDERVRQITIGELRVTAPGTLRLTLVGADGRVVARDTQAFGGDQSRFVRVAAPPGARASRLVFELATLTGERMRARITDLRVQGQTPALERYVAQRLTFPAPWARDR